MEQVEGCYGCRMLARRVADAQATIAALEADIEAKDRRIWELESWLQVKSPREITLMESKIIQLEHQLTQRTAELEAAKRERDVWYARYNELSGVKDRQLNDLQAELERVRAERDHAKKMEVVQKEVADNQTWHAQKLRTLIAANKETKHDAI